jgi:hypothetical protein
MQACVDPPFVVKIMGRWSDRRDPEKGKAEAFRLGLEEIK